jgi:hypothetical protein
MGVLRPPFVISYCPNQKKPGINLWESQVLFTSA